MNIRQHRWLYALALALALVACATPATLQQAIIEDKEGVIATKGLILQNLRDGYYSARKAESMLESVEAHERALKAAELLIAKDPKAAATMAGAARNALKTLRAQVQEKK